MEKQSNEEKAIKEEIVLFEFDKEQCDVIFVFDEATNISIHCPSSFLNRISKEFQNNMVKTDDGSHYEITAEGFGVDALKKALSFYQPKYFENFKDSDEPNHLKEVLTVSARFVMPDLQNLIQNYCVKRLRLTFNQNVMEEEDFTFLQLAKDFGLNALYNKLMGLEITLSIIIQRVNFTNTYRFSTPFITLTDDLRYKIIKKCIKSGIDRDNFNMRPQMSAIILEAMSIFHFLDLFFYENKFLDYALHSKNMIVSSTNKNDSSSLFKKNEMNDVLVKVEGRELFISSAILADNSPVFKAMLNSSFKEGLENVIELPGKRVEDIIEFFTSLLRKRESKEYNTFRLLPLCQEYQIDWLQDIIQDEMLQLQLPFDRLRLKYLNLSQNAGFLKGEEYFVNSLCESFIQLQKYKEFSDLKGEMKLLVALKRLWYVCNYINNHVYQNAHHLFDGNSGLLSIFKISKDITFNMNSIEQTKFQGIMHTQNPTNPFFVEAQKW